MTTNAATIHASFCRSPVLIPWSTASFASSGGTSATSVNASSEATAPAVRSGYGRASPNSIAMRRRDSGATTSRRPCRPAPRRGASPPARPSRRHPDLLEQAELVDLAEDGARLEQLGLRALGDDPPVLEHDDSCRRARSSRAGARSRSWCGRASPRRDPPGSATRSSRRRRQSRRRGSGSAGRSRAPARSRAAGAGRRRA